MIFSLSFFRKLYESESEAFDQYWSTNRSMVSQEIILLTNIFDFRGGFLLIERFCMVTISNRKLWAELLVKNKCLTNLFLALWICQKNYFKHAKKWPTIIFMSLKNFLQWLLLTLYAIKLHGFSRYSFNKKGRYPWL